MRIRLCTPQNSFCHSLAALVLQPCKISCCSNIAGIFSSYKRLKICRVWKMWQCKRNMTPISGSLPVAAQQLASIIPLSALIEFIDIGSKLHVFELTGSVPHWQWPVTPAGARVLLSNENTEDECTLDHPERSAVLECFDGRHGDRYPSSTPTTTRLWCFAHSVDRVVRNEHRNMEQPSMRPQRLELFRLIDRVALAGVATMGKAGSKKNYIGRALAALRSGATRYIALNIFGWLAWATLTALSLMSSLWVAAAYLLLIPSTGLIIFNTHGSRPRQLLNGNERGKYDRLVVATASLNSPKWFAFYGESIATNSLLSRPLLRHRCTYWPNFFRILLQLFILAQWGLVLASCVLTDWNAFFISVWIAFCAIASSYIYPPGTAARDWLRCKCNIDVKRIRADFSSRRAMLSVLVYINPDTVEGRTAWIDPILSKSSTDRQEWEAALLQYIEHREQTETIPFEKYWWKWIVEGVKVGEKIKMEL